MEKLFEVFPCSTTQKVLLATYTLKDKAWRWWLLVRNNNVNMTWAQFNEMFYNKYFPQCFRDRKVSEFQELKQGRISVAEYEAKFTELARFASHMVDTDYKKAHKFEGGLDLDIFDRVGVLKLPTYIEVLNRSLMAEAILAAMKQSKALTTTTKWRGKRRHRGVCYRALDACFRCGKTGHVVKDCPLGSNNANHPTASSAGSTSTAKTNARANTGKETLRQGRVFALVPGDVYNTEVVVSARKLLRKGCRGYLCCVLTVSSDSTSVEAIPSVCDFPDVLPNDLPGDLIDREIEFTIDVVPGTEPISKTPYRMSTSKLKELKVQLQEILDKKFIRPSTSPWKQGRTREPFANCLADSEKRKLKANTVADVLSRKSIANLSCLLTGQRELLCDLEKDEIEVVLHEQGGILVVISIQPTIIEEIKKKQCKDEFLRKIVDEIDSKLKPGFVLDNDVLKFQNRLCVPDCFDLRNAS
ncbi:uncharacterized protein LOC114286366 [Camellia sinensis]|uniref:uncharacterized protein LOC114286366 n=1 Tax=Camellia sinensis TaxID=4442 RepID=UPI0010366638|nr:uncharacterized protein LOC114286366 [Camellia sinensis]